ncbi:MAG: ATP-binding protein [Candidatus Dadabacteria bacterium]|nr:ATP-binding protein [Candidatus Dadabacteria bacterium]
MHYFEETGRLVIRYPTYLKEEFSNLRLSRQITLGYALMFFLMMLISVFSIYNIYRLDKAQSNIEGRRSTLSNLLSSKEKETETQEGFSFGNEMLNEALKIMDEHIGYAYVNIFTIIGMALLFGGILTLMIPRLITKPVSYLVNAAKSVARGDYSYRVNTISGSNEISSLIQAFNGMLENIEYHHEEILEKNNENLRLLEETKKFNEVLEKKIEEATREIKEKQEELIKAERLATLGEIATGIAHEVRNPLSGIAVALELMKNETQNQENKQTISEILKEIDRLERIVKDLLQFAYLSYPRGLNLIECNPNEIVERAISLVSLKTKEKGIDVEKNLDCTVQFKVDHEQIQQVIMNLLINGIEAMDMPGKLTVETANSFNSHVSIKVSDTGCGFSEEDKEKIFRPFYSTKEQGTGLGLSISRGIVEVHKGKILVSSEKNKGTTFTVMIPTNLIAE